MKTARKPKPGLQPPNVVIGKVSVEVERETVMKYKLVQSICDVYLAEGVTAQILTLFPVSGTLLVFRKKGEQDHVVNLRPIFDEVAAMIGWEPANSEDNDANRQ